MGNEGKSIQDLRSSIVYKSNDLILKARYDLPLQQQKILLYIISQMSPFDDDFKMYEFDCKTFCAVAGIDEDNGGNYRKLKEAIRSLWREAQWIPLDDDTESLCAWIGKAKIHKRSGTISIRLDEDLKPYLLNLQGNFTRYELVWTLRFRSRYSIRLYEIVRSIHYNELQPYTRRFALDELRRAMGAETYPEYWDFKQRALEPAVAEINKYSDKNVRYKAVKKGRTVAFIDLTVEAKEFKETMKLHMEAQEALGVDPDQMTLFDEPENERGSMK